MSGSGASPSSAKGCFGDVGVAGFGGLGGSSGAGGATVVTPAVFLTRITLPARNIMSLDTHSCTSCTELYTYLVVSTRHTLLI